MRLDGATFLLQWSAGGLLFAWVTTRRREVGLGYGWLLRIVFGLMAVGAAALYTDGALRGARALAFAGSAVTALLAGIALASSVVRRRAGVSGHIAARDRKRARVAAMVGHTNAPEEPGAGESASSHEPRGREFDPRLDLLAALAGFATLLPATSLARGGFALTSARLACGAAFLGCVSDAMLLGHWYLVQPGLRRDPLKQLVLLTALLWPFEVALFLVPTGMVSVINGSIDDGYHGLLGWTWIACAVTTIALVGVTWAALKERYYSAVMAATGLLYLAILTAFGTDLIARAVLAP